MAWTPPTKYLRRKELLSDKRFFRLLSEQSNFIDRDTTFMFYMGLAALIGDELRKNKFVRLPHLGDFALVEQKSRPAWVGRIHAIIAMREVLKFYPKERLRRYFGQRQGHPRFTEFLPPPPIRRPLSIGKISLSCPLGMKYLNKTLRRLGEDTNMDDHDDIDDVFLMPDTSRAGMGGRGIVAYPPI